MTTTSKELKIESLRLFQEYQRTGNRGLRNQLVQLNFGLVRKEAYHWLGQSPEGYEDLLQIGSIGLLRAIERFDPGKGYAFSSFAFPYIRGEIQHYLRDKSSSIKIPRRWLELGQKSAAIIREFRERLQRQPTDAEIAQGLGISLGDWEEVKLAHQNREPLSLDVSLNDQQEGETSLGDLVPDGHYRTFELAQDDKIRLQTALSELEDKTREILEFVFLQDLTQKETAERLGVSVITVSRRVKKGLESLRKLMTTEISLV
jgi:RNA polymerase sigma-B factor